MKELTRSDFEALRQGMLVGTARRPLVPPPALAPLIASAPALSDPALPLLALAGQRLRFERPAVLAAQSMPEAAIRLHSDPRPILREPARQALLRLVDSVHKDWTRFVVPAAARRVVAAGFKLHPFDLPRLMTVLKPHDDELGPAERAFLALSDPTARKRSFEKPYRELTADNWTEAPSRARQPFLRRWRALDPAATRALVEPLFASVPALVRLDIVSSLAVRLSADDLPLIERAATDSSATVKRAAASLLVRVPGTPDHAERLAAAAACFQREGGVANKLLRLIGIASAAGVLTFVPPAGAGALRHGSRGLFSGFSIRELAAEVGASVREIAEALPNDAAALPTFLQRAVEEGDVSTLQTLTLFKLLAGDRYPPAVDLIHLATSRVILSEEAAAEVLSSANWKGAVARLVNDGKDDGTLVLIATMLPRAVMPAFLATIISPSAAVPPARAFAELVLALEAGAVVHPNETERAERP